MGSVAKPRVVLHPAGYPNSWVTGIASSGTTLHLTSRLLELLDGPRLEAVIAHELAHVGQRDALLMSAIGSPVAAMLDGAAAFFHAPLRVARFTRATSVHEPARPGESPKSEAALYADMGMSVGFFWLLILPIGLLFLVIGAVARAITAVFSRARELEADAGAVRLTGSPSALEAALMTLTEASVSNVPPIDLRTAASLDVFHIVPVGKEHPLARTHPSLKRRMRQLQAIEARHQRSR